MNEFSSREIKEWIVEYDHKDGRAGAVNVKTVVEDSNAFKYGNGKCGLIEVGEAERHYDLRYEKGDLHLLMIQEFFGRGLVKAVEL